MNIYTRAFIPPPYVCTSTYMDRYMKIQVKSHERKHDSKSMITKRYADRLIDGLMPAITIKNNINITL